MTMPPADQEQIRAATAGETITDGDPGTLTAECFGSVRFPHGQIEAIPAADRSIDVIISNCVINLPANRNAVFAESHRVLRSGGSLGILPEDHLTPGFMGITITPMVQVADGVHPSIIRAVRP
jgi:arsenite methyltransferase